MRIIGEIAHPECRITLFHWNNRYLVKLEKDYLEQTYKIDQFELSSEQDLKALVNDAFVRGALERFREMEQSLAQSLQKL